jgi:hypothetical protein
MTEKFNVQIFSLLEDDSEDPIIAESEDREVGAGPAAIPESILANEDCPGFE